MQLNKKRELVARTFHVGKGRIIFNKEMLAEIKEAITKQDIEYLAELSRLTVTEEQKDHLVQELGSVVSYVSQISDVDSTPEQEFERFNILREDIATNIPGAKTEQLLSEAPSRHDQYVKVAKVPLPEAPLLIPASEEAAKMTSPLVLFTLR